ncbi:hypothetical protein BCD67_15555 [Oscillatoriales cyanobacterium USR001]|nr:hypothetical protein BCD67_15555 [Oscillatoriales cyanobacterium USR001]
MVKNNNNTENNNILADLALILPISLGVIVTLESWRFLVAIALIGGLGWGWRRYQRQQQQKIGNLDEVFYRLIKQNQGRVTALDLAINAKSSGEKVRQYLDTKAKEFGADFEVTEQGGIIYCFHSVQGLKKSENSSEIQRKSPELFPISEVNQIEESQFLTQVELAKRLNVHPTTVSKWKLKAEFPEWSCQKDPEAIMWEYSVENKRFFPKN